LGTLLKFDGVVSLQVPWLQTPDFKIESPTVLSEDILNDIVSEQELERLVSLEKDIKKMTEDLKHRKVEWL